MKPLFVLRVKLVRNIIDRKCYCNVAPLKLYAGKSTKFVDREVDTSEEPAYAVTLKVLGSGAHKTSASVYLHTDKNKYLFNAGENTQRMTMEHGLKLASVEHIFITSKRWDLIGGLPGLGLYARGLGTPSLTLHGPPGIGELFTALNRLVRLDAVNVRTVSCVEQKCFEDPYMKIEYVPIFRKLLNTNDTSEYNNGRRDAMDNKGTGQNDGVIAASSSMTSTDIHDLQQCAVCYICRPTKRRGNLLLDSIVELGLPPTMVNHLKAGRNVKLPTGKVLSLSDISTPDCPGKVFIIADCPTEDYIDSLVTNPVWSKYQKQKLDVAENLSPKIIVHFTPEKILLDPRYISWMESFDSTTQHLLINDSCRSLGSESVHRVQHKLNIVDDKIFPLLYSDCERIVESTTNPTSQMGDSESKSESDCELVESPACVIPPQLQHIKVPIILAETMLRYYIRPQKKNMLDDTWVIRLNPKKYNKEALEANMFSECCDNYKNAQNQLKKNASHEEFPQVLFLGTGSSMPNKIRNVSGILLQMTENTRMILDCGEGTYSQLLRFYGPHETAKVLVETKAIYISHLHSDHHLGLIGLLRARRSAFQQFNIPFQPLVLLAPEQILYLLTVYNVNFESIEDTYKLIYNQRLCLDHSKRNKNEIFGALGFKNIATIPVLHPANSFGVTLEHQSGWKITYSGDTRPCERLVELGRNSDLCIHEATMEDELIADAKSKRHSTTSEAIEIGEKMNAKFILLTHFSQRYSKVPKIDGGLPPNVGIAFDNMLVRLTDIPKLPSMYPIFKYLFAEDVEEMELRSELKRLKAMRGKKEARSC